MDATLQNIMATHSANALIVITAKDLSEFADSLINRTRQIVEAEYKDQYYTVKELAALLHVTQATIYNFSKQGKLSPVKIGSRTVFSRSAVNDAISQGVLGRYNHK